MIRYPEDKQFAFTILDDTDDATFANVQPIYQLLSDLGMRTTKTAWPLDCPEGSRLYFAAETLQNEDYLHFVKRLISDGFEFACHGATMESSIRERTMEGLKFIREILQVNPRIYCNHGQNRENLYWGAQRYQSRFLRHLFELISKSKDFYQGQKKDSPYFWGDICKDTFQYVRSYAFNILDVTSIKPAYPYALKQTPYVNYWFITADAPDVHSFTELVTPQAIDKMVARGGYTIISTHLGKGFVEKGQVNEDVVKMLKYISTLPGWFVPVGELLDFLRAGKQDEYLSEARLFWLELGHVLDRIKSQIKQRIL